MSSDDLTRTLIREIQALRERVARLEGSEYVGRAGEVANASGEGASVDADGTLTVKLGDNAGTEKLSVTDSDDAEVASVDSDGVLALADGITAPDTSAGFAQIYVDTADGDLKVKFGDGHTATLATDS